MRRSTKDSLTKMVSILKSTDRYLSAEKLGQVMHTGKSSIYRFMKIAREQGIGVYSVPKKGGYILSECANRNDDVHFLRVINGKHIGSTMALAAAKHDILNRWKNEKDRQLLIDVINPMISDVKLLQHNEVVLVDKLSKL